VVRDRHSNVSLSYVLILLKRLLNRLICDDQQTSWYLYGTFDYLAAIDTSAAKRTPVDEDFAASFRARHRATNAAISHRYFGSDKDVFSYPAVSRNGSFAPGDVHRILAELVESAPEAVTILSQAIRDPAFVSGLPRDERQLAMAIRSAHLDLSLGG
jgi:hypothetical protein